MCGVSSVKHDFRWEVRSSAARGRTIRSEAQRSHTGPIHALRNGFEALIASMDNGQCSNALYGPPVRYDELYPVTSALTPPQPNEQRPSLPRHISDIRTTTFEQQRADKDQETGCPIRTRPQAGTPRSSTNHRASQNGPVTTTATTATATAHVLGIQHK